MIPINHVSGVKWTGGGREYGNLAQAPPVEQDVMSTCKCLLLLSLEERKAYVEVLCGTGC